jgi:hypothetical protein
MKQLKASAIGVLLSLCYIQAGAQEKQIPINEPDYNKPKLFNSLPQKMNLRLSEVASVFDYAVGTVVNLQLTDNFLFQGLVVSKSDPKDLAVKSIVIRSASLQGATFSFSKTINTDGTESYIGRIMSRNNGDAYEIKKENNQYVLQKKNLNEIIAE